MSDPARGRDYSNIHVLDNQHIPLSEIYIDSERKEIYDARNISVFNYHKYFLRGGQRSKPELTAEERTVWGLKLRLAFLFKQEIQRLINGEITRAGVISKDAYRWFKPLRSDLASLNMYRYDMMNAQKNLTEEECDYHVNWISKIIAKIHLFGVGVHIGLANSIGNYTDRVQAMKDKQKEVEVVMKQKMGVDYSIFN